jgi:hypothetical protein
VTGKTVVPEEAVEAAANELHDREGYAMSLADSPAYRKAYYGEVARQMLEAAAPFIAAKALEDAAADAPRRHDEVISAEECRDWAEWLRVYAAAVRGEG